MLFFGYTLRTLAGYRISKNSLLGSLTVDFANFISVLNRFW